VRWGLTIEILPIHKFLEQLLAQGGLANLTRTRQQHHPYRESWFL
jgi:hypothetical protein